jgi:plastocyanin
MEKNVMIFSRLRPWLSSMSLALLLGGVVSLQSSAQTADKNQVTIKDFMFMPNALTVKAGSTVTWVNLDDEPHTVVSDTKMFRSGALDTKESFSFKFAEPGTYHFTCSIHPRMVGTIVVQ